jgi:UDP-N-acetylglucosamine--N-acetylmuramyl-(pentapeptide) pyrophosphoryl-undecaprenol N-acetylglucosamine transferase
VDDHQTRNAGYLVGADAATLLPEAGLTPARLAAEIRRHDRALVTARALRARALARPGATADIVAACLGAAGSS